MSDGSEVDVMKNRKITIIGFAVNQNQLLETQRDYNAALEQVLSKQYLICTSQLLMTLEMNEMGVR
jgi:hypothetical protein